MILRIVMKALRRSMVVTRLVMVEVVAAVEVAVAQGLLNVLLAHYHIILVIITIIFIYYYA